MQEKHRNAVKEIDDLLCLTHIALKSIQCKVGKMREVKLEQ